MHVQTKDEDRLEWLRGAASARLAALATSSGVYLMVMKMKMSSQKFERVDIQEKLISVQLIHLL